MVVVVMDGDDADGGRRVRRDGGRRTCQCTDRQASKRPPRMVRPSEIDGGVGGHTTTAASPSDMTVTIIFIMEISSCCSYSMRFKSSRIVMLISLLVSMHSLHLADTLGLLAHLGRFRTSPT